jgi:hypothetical protein
MLERLDQMKDLPGLSYWDSCMESWDGRQLINHEGAMGLGEGKSCRAIHKRKGLAFG